MSLMLIVGMLAAAVAAEPLRVEVQTLSGPAESGTLVAVGDSGLVLETAEGRKTLPLADLLTVEPQQTAAPGAAQDATRVQLSGGSLLLGKDYSVSDRLSTLELFDGTRLELPTRTISWVRFRAPSDGVNAQWRMITDQQAAGDVIVIRKSPTALDQLEGVLHDVAEQKVIFEFDGDKIPVGIEKLEGLVYFHALKGSNQQPLCKVTTHDGSVWNARELEVADGALRLTTLAGVEARLPLPQVRLFDFSSGNVMYLSDLEPVSSTWTPFLESPLLDAKLQQLFGPKRDRSFDGGELRLGDRAYRKGLALHSRSELVYRLTEPFRRLQAQVGIDDSLRNVGHVELVIFGDDKELYRQPISGRDEPRALDLDISGVRRLRILVDYGEKLDIADHLHLCNARIIK